MKDKEKNKMMLMATKALLSGNISEFDNILEQIDEKGLFPKPYEIHRSDGTIEAYDIDELDGIELSAGDMVVSNIGY